MSFYSDLTTIEEVQNLIVRYTNRMHKSKTLKTRTCNSNIRATLYMRLSQLKGEEKYLNVEL